MERVAHCFAIYKLLPGQKSQVSVQGEHHSATAQEVVAVAVEDYQDLFGQPQGQKH
jgi:hypothetical protein